jgi:DNA topoisomerase I
MSAENIVIVESPSKAKTINKYLGEGYKVFASYGHIRDLPSKTGSVNPENNFEMTWAIEEDSQKRVNEIKVALKHAKCLILATDPDREGEAISWHIWDVLLKENALKKIDVQRVTFNEITKQAVQTAMAHPRAIDQQLVHAYLARRALDYLVGFNLSPVLWRKLPGARSAGRVQSVALRMVVEREKEIESFIPQEYWSVISTLSTPKKEKFEARIASYQGKKLQKLDIPQKGMAVDIQKTIETGSLVVKTVESKPFRRNPSAPFITSTLQQEASRKLGFSATKTMMLAQKLYEGVEIKGEVVGLITYMRTDGVSLAQEAVETIRTQIQTTYGQAYLPSTPRLYKSKAKNAQEAHEAIRPTHITLIPEKLTFLEKDMQQLYALIWMRTMACQMESAVLERTTIDIDVCEGGKTVATLRATGSVLTFDGFLALYQEGKDDDEDEDNRKLPRIVQGDILGVEKVKPEQHHTEPAPRFSEASLVKQMEELGIGRPSTYASTLGVLRDRQYVRFEKGRFIPEDQGRIVTHFLAHYFKTYVAYDFTASLEEKLDLISDGKLGWLDLLNQFWVEFSEAIKAIAPLRITEVIDYLNEELAQHLFPPVLDENGQPTGADPRECSVCHEGQMSLKLGRFGAFVGCSRYPECRHARPLTATGRDAGEALDSSGKSLGLDPVSGLEVLIKSGRFGPYVEVGTGKEAKRTSIPKAFSPSEISLEQALILLTLPRPLGVHPETGDKIVTGLGKFGPYIQVGEKYHRLAEASLVLTLDLAGALKALLEKPVPRSRTKASDGSTDEAKGATAEKNKGRTLGENPSGKAIILKEGRFGPYVTDGKVNATIPRSFNPEEITLSDALDILHKKAQKMLEAEKNPDSKTTKPKAKGALKEKVTSKAKAAPKAKAKKLSAS